MTPRIDLRTSTGQLPPIDLGQVDLGLFDGDGQERQLVITNRDTLNLSEIRVGVEGPGARAVQLARDLDGDPGTWTGGEIIALSGVLPPNNACQFWARAVRSDDIAVGSQDFEFVVKLVAVTEQ